MGPLVLVQDVLMAELRRRVRAILLADVEVEGRRLDVLVDGGTVQQVGTGLLRRRGLEVVRGGGGALLPGLVDHHLHLLATAAAASSVRCGPPEVRDVVALRAALRQAGGAGWVRGTGYHDSVAGPLDRARLDELVPDRPVRVQHRSGGLWILNGRALRALGITDVPDGRVWRSDLRLRPGVGAGTPWPDVATLGQQLAEVGVLGVADATPELQPAALRALQGSDLPQEVLLLGAPDGWREGGSFRVGPRKILLGDEADLDLAALVAQVEQAHGRGRPVAVHTVTRASLVVALSALTDAGVVRGDRLEHAAVVPRELRARIAELGLVVVTQPALAATRGDDYLREVDVDDRDLLWPFASLRAAGARVVASSDAPYGPWDPWEVLRQARDRLTPSGHRLGKDESVPVDVALRGLLGPLDDPGGPVRRVQAGAPADLVLMHAPLREVLLAPSRDLVRLVLATR